MLESPVGLPRVRDALLSRSVPIPSFMSDEHRGLKAFLTYSCSFGSNLLGKIAIFQNINTAGNNWFEIKWKGG